MHNENERFFLCLPSTDHRLNVDFDRTGEMLDNYYEIPQLAKRCSLHITLVAPLRAGTTLGRYRADTIARLWAPRVKPFKLRVGKFRMDDARPDDQTLYRAVAEDDESDRVYEFIEDLDADLRTALPGQVVERTMQKLHLSYARNLSSEQARRVMKHAEIKHDKMHVEIKFDKLAVFVLRGKQYKVTDQYVLGQT